MNEQEVIAIAKTAYMSGQCDKFTEYSRHYKNFRFKDKRSERQRRLPDFMGTWGTDAN